MFSTSFIVQGIDRSGHFIRNGIDRYLEKNIPELVHGIRGSLHALEQELALGLTELAGHGSQGIAFGTGIVTRFERIERTYGLEIFRFLFCEHAMET